MAFASIDDVTLHYRLAGARAGVPLVLVNSLGTDLRIWEDVEPLLSSGHRILSYDKRGHGLSDAPPGPYVLDDHVGDLLGLAEFCGFTRFALCGISIGGMIAMRFAALYPGKLASLVLCDTGAAIGTAEAWNERIATVRKGGMTAIADAVMDRWVSPGYRQRRPAAFAGWRTMLERCSPEGYMASCATVRDSDLSADLPRITAPTLVIVGDGDVSTPLPLARHLADTIPHAELRQISGAGHVPTIEQPEALATLIRDHLNEVVHV